MIEIVVDVLLGLLLVRRLPGHVLLLLGIHLRMIVAVVVVAMHVVRIVIVVSAGRCSAHSAAHSSSYASAMTMPM